jgi:GR25 family glycosyltransferase involved in LPS biosynthesis
LCIIQEAQKLNLENVLILEDDSLFIDNFEYRFYEAWREVPTNWNMVYLGGNNNSPFGGKISHKINNKLYRSLSTLTTHAYALKNNIYDLFINEIKKLAYSLDLCYIKLQPSIKAYCLVPALVTQRNGYSDIQMTNVDYSDCIK